MQYSNIVINHFEAPRNVTRQCAESALTGRGGSLEAGALIEFCLTVTAGVVERATFRAWGCPYAVAISSWLTGRLQGRPVQEVGRLDLDQVTQALDVPAGKWYCVLAAEDALRSATEDIHGLTD